MSDPIDVIERMRSECDRAWRQVDAIARERDGLRARVARLESTLARLTDADGMRDFPRNTCAASRFAQQIGDDLMQGDEDSQARGAAILTTVRCLWECRTLLQKEVEDHDHVGGYRFAALPAGGAEVTTLDPIDVTVRLSAGAYVAIARGKAVSASCTSDERTAVERLARKIAPDLRPLIERTGSMTAGEHSIRHYWRITWQPRP